MRRVMWMQWSEAEVCGIMTHLRKSNNIRNKFNIIFAPGFSLPEMGSKQVYILGTKWFNDMNNFTVISI